MAKTFSYIGSASSTGSSSTLTISSIPSTYKHLWIMGAIGTSGDTALYLRINGDSGGNYALQEIYADGSAPQNQRDLTLTNAAGNTSVFSTANAGVCGFEAIIPNYLSSAYKEVLWDGNSGKYLTGTAHGYNLRSISTWKNTSAITSISMYIPSGTMTNTSQVTVYGLL